MNESSNRPAMVRGRAMLRSGLRRLIHNTLFLSLSLGAMLALWEALLRIANLNPYFAKDPYAVYQFLFQEPTAAANRMLMWTNLVVTLRDAVIGYVVGTSAAIIVAMWVVSSRTVEGTMMPLAITLRSVPLVAMMPLIALIFGRSLMAVTVITSLITFFPSLVLVVGGLRSAAPGAVDLVKAYGGGAGVLMVKVRLPSAIPSVFASARIAAPAALLGATLAEWLATGTGLGYLMISAAETSQFAALWAAVVLVTAASLGLYQLVGVVEQTTRARYAL